jgi:hypothetical protein
VHSVTILQTLQKTARANAEVAAIHTGDELSRRFQESVRSALPRSGGITGSVLRRVQQLEIAVAVLRAGRKNNPV